MINWKAIEAGEEEISQVTLALSAFYRTTLNKGKNLDQFAAGTSEYSGLCTAATLDA